MAISGFTVDGAESRFVDPTELAAALAAKADITAVNAKANTASPTFTGDPKAPTPTAGDNDTSIATTAFVTTAVAGKANSTALITGLPTTVGTSGQVLKSTGTAVTWQADTNTTYTALTQAQAVDPASTAAGLATGQRIAESVVANAPVKSAAPITIPPVPATGSHTLQAVAGVLTWVAVA